MATTPNNTVLLADGDVIVRLALGEYLRACGLTVLEAATGEEAKAILQSGMSIDSLFCDAQLPGTENGFALAQWVRRYRPAIHVVLTTSLESKTEAAGRFCAPDGKGHSDLAGLSARIRAMQAERQRRARPPSSTKTIPAKRRRLT